MNRQLEVNINKENKYQVILGYDVLPHLESFLLNGEYSKIFIIYDKNLNPKVVDNIVGITSRCAESIFIQSPFEGEHNKTIKSFQFFAEELLKSGLKKHHCIIAFGGGAICDVIGFVASSIFRGVDLVIIPTTLLSIIDSSIGGKNGINTEFSKNTIGTFFHPKFVISDLSLLSSLPDREFLSGYAELAKHAIIDDKALFEELCNNENAFKLRVFDKEWFATIVEKSSRIKSRIVSLDPNEMSGARTVLNFGHTVGHALELISNYNMKHGEAIAFGMIIESTVSELINIAEIGTTAKIKSHMLNVGLLKNITFDIDATLIRNAMLFDKKNISGGKSGSSTIFCTIIKDIGIVFPSKSVEMDIVLKAIDMNKFRQKKAI